MSRTRPWIVAVGASGGPGLGGIARLLASLPSPLRAIVLVVLHREWGKRTHLRSILAHACSHSVVIAEDGECLEPDTVYIGEPDQHLTLVARNFGKIIPDPGRQYRNRTVDLLLRSVAEYGGSKAIGVVLAGALDDGARGLAAIHEARGLTMVLTPEPKVMGMPETAIGFDGPIDVIGSPEAIATAILNAVRT